MTQPGPNVSVNIPPRIVVLHPSTDEARALGGRLAADGIEADYHHLRSREELAALLQDAERGTDLVLVHPQLEPSAIMLLLHGQDIPVIVLGGGPDETLEALQAGARDVVDAAATAQLAHAARRELDALRARRDADRYRTHADNLEQGLHALIEAEPSPMACIRGDLHIDANAAYLVMFGIESQDALRATPFLDVVAPEQRQKLEQFVARFRQTQDAGRRLHTRLQARDGRAMDAEIMLHPGQGKNSDCTRIVVASPEPCPEEGPCPKPARLAQHSLLTAFHNRQQFMDELAARVARAGGAAGNSTLLYIAIDNLAGLGEKLGPDAATHIVADIAATIHTTLKAGNLMAQFGRDAFAVLVDGGGAGSVRAFSETLRKGIEQHVWQEGGQAIIDTCSICIYQITTQLEDPIQAIQQAEAVCRKAQEEGGNRIAMHPDTAARYEQEQQGGKRIREALVNNRFRLFYQPIANLHGEPMEMYEVLLRMLGDDGAILFPGQFFPSPVDHRLMNTLDRWVIDHAILQLEEIQRTGKRPLLFIKLSNALFEDDTLSEWLMHRASKAPAAAAGSVLEINEADALEHLDQAKAFVREATGSGFRVALTRFGSSVNSAGILQHLPVTFVKLDGDLVKSLVTDEKGRKTVRVLTKTAHDAGPQVIADYVENAETLAQLWQAGVDYASGYYIQIPTRTADFDFIFNI